MTKSTNILTALLLGIVLTSCFTGVESTKKITSKDVQKQERSSKNDTSLAMLDDISNTPFSSWQKGKCFIVTDDQIAMALTDSVGNYITTRLKGHVITYASYSENNIYTDKPLVVLHFKDEAGGAYQYATHKSLDELGNGSAFRLPFTVEADMVEYVRGLIQGKTFYIKTDNWYNRDGELTAGRKYVPVKITAVTAGNMIYALNVAFECDGKTAFVYVSSKNSSNRNRTFSSLFTQEDPHKNYPTISADTWTLIQNSKLREGMTKDECHLSIGSPANTYKQPSINGLSEIWQYSDGVFLNFTDGILVKFHK